MNASAGVDRVLEWLLQGDPAVQYQTRRDLLDDDRPALQASIATEGEGAAILAARGPDGHWGRGFYQPKWTCTHYTLLELMGLGLAPDNPIAGQSVAMVLDQDIGPDGGVNPAGTVRASDVCTNGLFLSYAAYFRVDEGRLRSVLDFLLGQRLDDGGFNCRSNRSGARVSSIHSTVSVLEGLTAYRRAGHTYRVAELAGVVDGAGEYLLRHRLCRRESTGEVMRAEFLRLHHPTRWYYDVLRGLEALWDCGLAADSRTAEALGVLRSRRRPDGRWAANRGYPGQTHVPMPQAGQPHRWITLRAMRALRRHRMLGEPGSG